MAQDVVIPVIGVNAKVACTGRIPPTIELVDLKRPPSQNKPQRPLVSAMPRITLHSNLVHRIFALGNAGVSLAANQRERHAPYPNIRVIIGFCSAFSIANAYSCASAL